MFDNQVSVTKRAVIGDRPATVHISLETVMTERIYNNVMFLAHVES